MNGVMYLWPPKRCSTYESNPRPWPHSSQSYISVNCLMEVSLAYLQTADWHLLSVELQVHSNALCSNQFCPLAVFGTKGIILLIGSKSWNSWEGYLFKNHKRNAIKSFGKILRRITFPVMCFSLFHNIKDEIFFSFWSVLRSLTSSLKVMNVQVQ